jgi:hypothetical protein
MRAGVAGGRKVPERSLVTTAFAIFLKKSLSVGVFVLLIFLDNIKKIVLMKMALIKLSMLIKF